MDMSGSKGGTSFGIRMTLPRSSIINPNGKFFQLHVFLNFQTFNLLILFIRASKDGKDVIIPLVPTDIMRNDVGLSTGDITKVTPISIQTVFQECT